MKEPAFDIPSTTFCIWRSTTDSDWKIGEIDYPPGDDPDGAADLLFLYDGDPMKYQQWSEEYYEQPVSLETVRRLYAHEPLTNKLVKTLNCEISLKDLREDILEIGYPSTGH